MTGVWFYFEDDLVRFIDMYREIIPTITYENVTRYGMSIQLIMRPLGLFLSEDNRIKLCMFGTAMQAHLSACGVIVSGMVMIPPNERMTNYSVRILTVLRYVDSITMLHPSVWLGLRFSF